MGTELTTMALSAVILVASVACLVLNVMRMTEILNDLFE